MKKKLQLSALALATLLSFSANAQVKLHGVAQNNRYDDGDQMKSEYLGWNSELSKAIFMVDLGLWSMSWDGVTLSTPEKEPAVVREDVIADKEKAVWATNFNLMLGNSGALYRDGKLITVMSRDEQSTTDEELFNVRRWNAVTGELISTETRPKSDCLESAGMSYNPIDGKVYGLFYLTEQQLSEEFTDDPDFFVDEDGESSDVDAGYCLCTIDLETLKVTPITRGLYYQNFVTFAINSDGRAFALTSGGGSAPAGDDGKVRDSQNNLVGAQLYEFNLKTGNMILKEVQAVDSQTGETYVAYEPMVHGTGYYSQYRRQSACFAKSNPDKMYWNGFFNSGKGINDWGSWSTLPDREWRTNGKYDTCLYEVDINTGEATLLSKINNRWTFSAMWVDGDDCSDGAGDVNVIDRVAAAQPTVGTQVYNMQGQQVDRQGRGLYIVKQGDKTRKVMMR